MKHFIGYSLGVGIVCSVLGAVLGAERPVDNIISPIEPFTPPVDSGAPPLHYPIHDRHADKYNEPSGSSPLNMGDPGNIKDSVEYDPVENQYNISEHIGNQFYRNPSYLTFEEFRAHEFDKSTKEYWKQRASEEDELHKKSFAPKLIINSVIFDRIFGGNSIDIRPQGSAELTFALKNQKNDNPALPVAQRSVTTFDFNENIQLNVTANIGDKMKLGVNYNTQATFDFENKMKLEYTGYEDDIIKKIEAGNVTLPLNSQLIQGSQSLFGIKTQLQFGRLMVTAVFSQQKGKSQTIEVKGGAQTTKYDIKGDQYEANRHFFLTQYFRNNYETALKDINQIRTGVNITRIEVWVRNTTSTRQNDATRNLIAVADLGETTNISPLTAPSPGSPPDNNANNLFSVARLNPTVVDQMRDNTGVAANTLTLNGLQNSRDYIVQENARLLSPSEYTVNSQLGYISLNSELATNQILAVAFEYTLNGHAYHVGELSTAGVVAPKALFVKLLRSTSVDPSFFTWDLMMKNVYNLGGYQLKQDQFRLDVVFQDDRVGGFINYIPDGCDQVKGIPLIKVLGLDKLNANGDPQPDGVFDWKEGITISAANGRIYFPVLEPFGSSLRAKFCSDNITADKYVYQALYDTTRVIAQQQAERNKFSLRGTYQSSSGSDIPLNAVNVPPGSVKVTAGGQPLKEGIDYTVDYTLGRVKIINEAYLKSNTPIQISLESQSLFNIQTKTMYGARFDYTFNKNFIVGGTVLHLGEKPITQKVNYGDEPISNTILGADATYRTDSRFLTNLLDRLPLYNTKEVSTITLSGEAARLFPGHSSAVGAAGTSYIDDFEGAITPLDIKNPGQWFLASTPQNQHDLFPEDSISLSNGYNRAKLAWYYVDNLFQSRTSSTPDDVTNDEMSNNYVRDIQEPELFPNKSQINGPRSLICTNMAFYPSERGPYNYDVNPTTVSSGVDTSGNLKDPEKRWGGVMRKIETTDFQNANIEFLQFWVMDPFADDSPNDGSGGDFYINLGDVSEDVLRDNHKCYENGIYDPSGANPPDTGIWGKYPDPNLPQIGYNFDFDATNRAKQDVGIDGLNDAEEQGFYSNYLNLLGTKVGPNSNAYAAAHADPSNDDFNYFQSNTYNSENVSPLDRYKRYNNMEGNSPTADQVDGYRALGSQYPDYEDLNRDFTLNTEENYLQYHLDLRPNKMVIGQNYITDIVSTDVRNLPNGVTGRKIKWFQIKIPIGQPDKTVGAPNLTYINAIRLFMRGFRTPIIMRFAKMEFLRGEWRKYDNSLLQPGEFDPIPEYPGNTSFDVSYVSIEENSSRQPINYVLPPGIDRERDISTTQLASLNEQSLSMKVCKLKDGDSRAIYKTTQLDIRTYKKLKMYMHAESSDVAHPLADKDMTAFIRIGSDFVDNYYEYEIPLYITQPQDNNPDHIWPEQNNLEINLDDLVNKKTERNNAMIGNASITLLTPYPRYDSPATEKRITIKGSPNLSNVRVIMIGLRNPKNTNPNGEDLCGEVWVNELRLSDFDEKGGWAAIARVQAKLADLGNVSVVGSHSTAGWGSIEKRVNERDKVDKTSYDITTNLELGKFIPEKAGIKVPVFFEYAEDYVKPQYTPLDPDVLYVNSIENAPSEARDSIKNSSLDYTRRKSLNFTNVKKTKTGKGGKSHIYDIENLSATYAYTEIFHRNSDIEYSLTKTYQGILGYAFNNQAKPMEPFKKMKFLSSPYLKLIKDFNFNYAPSSITLRAMIDRMYSEQQLRNNTGLNFKIDPTFFKTYRMMRNYGLAWDLTKSLKFDYAADVLADINEPPGRLDTQQEKDSVKTNLKNLGRTKNYHHIANVTYNIPLNKIPLIDWVTASVRYSGDYRWTAGALTFDTAANAFETNSFQNIIQNSQTINYNGNLNFTTLYNKSSLLRKYTQPKQPDRGAKPDMKPKKPLNPRDSLLKAKQDSLQKKNPWEPVYRGIASLLTMVKSANATYSETNGTLLPGFIPKPQYIGTNFDFSNSDFPHSPTSNAPGLGFIFGSQHDLRPDAIKYHWLTSDTSLNSQYVTTNLQNFTGRISIEPIKSFKIDVSFNRNYSITKSEYFHASPNGDFETFSPTQTGNFTISYLTWNTSFVKDAGDYSNSNFKHFSSYRPTVSQLLGSQNPASIGTDTIAGYKNGYGPTQQEVLTYAFLAAYAGKTPDGKSTERFPKIPKPNWRITYDGLGKLKFFQSFLQTLTLSHGFRSTYSVNSFTQNLLYNSENGQSSVLDTVGNFIPQYDFQQISIAEQYSPLIGIDMTFKNSLQARFEYKRDRTVSLSFASIQVTEVRGEEYSIGAGYKFKRVKLPFVRVGPAKTRVVNDLNLKGDFSLRKNTTIIRKLVENANQPSAGSTTISVKVSLDYNISERINLKLFADKMITNPFVSTTFPTSTLTAGITIRFTLAQ